MVSDTLAPTSSWGRGGTLYLVYPGMHLRYGFFVSDTLAPTTPSRLRPRAYSPEADGGAALPALRGWSL